MSPIPSILIALGLAAFVAAPDAQETLSSVQRELERVEKEIEREKELHKTERKRATDFEAEKAAKLRALQEQTRLTQGKIDSLGRHLERARQQKAGFKGQSALYQGKQREFMKALVESIRAQAKETAKDFPYQREKRASDLEELAKALENGVVSVEDGLGRLHAMLQSSLDFAYETEVYRGGYKATDGSDHEGSYVRLGAVLLAFASEDGQTAAFLAKEDSAYVWKDKDLDPAVRENILEAVKVAQGKAAPRLVELPFKAPKAGGAP